MNSLNDQTIFYHGTTQLFEDFDFAFADPFKDFGKGFYLTSVYQQAYKWATKREDDVCYIYKYGIDIPDNSDLRVLELVEYNVTWLSYVARNRKFGDCGEDFDIVYDKIADGKFAEISRAVDNYLDNKITAEAAIKKMMWRKFPKRFGDQYCFKTARAVSCLELQECRCLKKNPQGLYDIALLELPTREEEDQVEQ